MKKKITYSLILFIIGVVLGVLVFTKCQGNNHKSNAAVVLEAQYKGLQTEFINLVKSKKEVDLFAAKKAAELEEAKAEKQKAIIKYVKVYEKGRGTIEAHDSVCFSAYDTLNAECLRLEASNKKVIARGDSVAASLNKKVAVRDSIIGNREGVIKLDAIAVALTRDSLKTAIKTGNKKALKWFFIGTGVGAAATTAAGAAVILKK